MVTTALIKIWGELIGAVAWDSDQELAYFEYDEKFVQKKIQLAPLKMPVDRRDTIFSFPENRALRTDTFNTFKGLPGLLADVLPDKYGNELINLYLARQGRPENSMNPVEQLCFMGSRGMGALEFEPSSIKTRTNSSVVEMNSLVEIAQKMLENRSEFQTVLNRDQEQSIKQLITIGTSAGGARPKAVIAFNEISNEVRSGQANIPEGFEHWLIKLDGVSDIQLGDSQGYGRVEMAYYLMALKAGIDMMPSRLLEENGRAHFMTKRFDRDHNIKHHVQTFCAMKHFDFNKVTSYSYEQLFQTMRELRLSYSEGEQLFRRMVFNVMARNCDDHTKNFSFILKQGEKWRLAPAYDICHAYRPDSLWVSQHALSINGKRKDFSVEDLLSIAKGMNIKKPLDLIQEVQNAVCLWDDFAHQVKVSDQKREAIKQTLILSF